MKISVSRLINKYIVYFFAVIIVLGLCIVTYLVLIPKIKEIFEKRQTLETKKTLLDDLIVKRRLLDSMSGGDNLRYFEEAQKALPNEKDAAQILISMDNLVQRSQFGIMNINLNPGIISSKSADKTVTKTINQAEKSKGANFMPIKITGAGDTTKFLNFIKELTNIRPLFDIHQISLNYQTDSENKDTLKADLSLNAFYLAPITTIGALDSTLPELTPKEKQTLIGLANLQYLGNIPEENNISIPVGKNNLFVP